MRNLIAGFPPEATPTAGEICAELLRTHGRQGTDPYLDQSAANMVAGADLEQRGDRQSAEAHIRATDALWGDDVGKLTGRHVVLGLALLGLGDDLLESGVVASILTLWSPGYPPDEPERVAWDALSDEGRRLAEAQPLLAVALGAPAETELPLTGMLWAMAWSPRGDQLALLLEREIVVVTPGRADATHLGDTPVGARSLGWGPRGVTVLTVDDGLAEVRLAGDDVVLGAIRATGGVLSGDGSSAWIRGYPGVVRWSPTTGAEQAVSGSEQRDATPLAVDHTGTRGLVHVGNRVALTSTAAPPGSRIGDTSWPADAATLMGWAPAAARVVALAGPLRCVAATERGLELRKIAGDVADADGEDGLLVCRVATGRVSITDLAIDASGTQLAVAADGHVRTWSLRPHRAQTLRQPDFDNDRPDLAVDHLDTGRDARAIAALIASKDLVPPLSIGLFGDWGSGKSFVLRQIMAELEADKPPGFLKHLRVVEFNAWQYAETNLWASLVDAVLRKIGPLQDAPPPHEVGEAQAQQKEAEDRKETANEQLRAAEQEVTRAKEDLAKRRRLLGFVVGGLLLVLAGVVAAVALGWLSGIAALWPVVVSIAGLATVVVQQATRAAKTADQAAQTVTSGVELAGSVLGRPESQLLAMRVAEREEAERQVDAATVLLEERTAQVTTAQQHAEQEPLQALLHGLTDLRVYRDQLSMVTRVHDLFHDIDQAVSATRRREDAGGDLDRVVVVIDDLDRCPPEKVVGVLEAVHLLFSFEMFVVVIAVDTRWLEQSLRIRYRQLLGRTGTAAPTDYLEKILQVPIQLPTLGPSRVRRLITGLANATEPPPEAQGAPASASDAASDSDAVVLSQDGNWLTAATQRIVPPDLAADVLRVSPRETSAMLAVADLFATTPRTVKRFVNTFRLLKASAAAPDSLDAEVGGRLGDHEIVAFLLAVVIGKPAAAAAAFEALGTAAPTATVGQAIPADPPDPVAIPGATPDVETIRRQEQLSSIQAWLSRNARYANEPTERVATWLPDVARYSFTRVSPPTQIS